MILHSNRPEIAPGGFLGVDVFFVLSGFLITSLLLEEWREMGSINIKAFYARRALRLFPAIIILLSVLWIDAVFLHSPLKVGKGEMLRATGFIASYITNWVLAFDHPFPTSLTHFWSLAIEEQFYIVWPLALILLLRLKLRSVSILGILCFGAILIACWRAFLYHKTLSYVRCYYGTDSRTDGLLIGGAIALLVHSGAVPDGARLRRLLMPLALLSTVVLATLVFTESPNSFFMFGRFSIVALIVAVLLLYSVFVGSPVLCLTPLVWIGRISHGGLPMAFPGF